MSLIGKITYFFAGITNNISKNRRTVIDFYFFHSFWRFVFTRSDLIYIITNLFNWIFVDTVCCSFRPFKLKDGQWIAEFIITITIRAFLIKND